MVFNKQKNSFFRDKSKLKMELFYLSLVCLVANFLSSIALEIGTRLPLGQTASVIKAAGLPAFFQRTYNLKVKLFVSDIVSGFISTTLIVLGEHLKNPYLFVPWLINTMRGILLCEGPMLLGLGYMILPESDVPARSFILLTLLLYVEELCLWKKIFFSFRQSWIEYKEYKQRLTSANSIKNTTSTSGDKKPKKQPRNVENHMKTTNLLNKLRCWNY